MRWKEWRRRTSAWWSSRSLATQTILAQTAVLVVALGVLSGVQFGYVERIVKDDYASNALAIGRSVAGQQEVRRALSGDSLTAAYESIQPLAESVRKSTGALFVVVADHNGIRVAHPDPHAIYKPLSTDPGQALQGIEYTAVEEGTLGPSVRAKVPVFSVDDPRHVVGVVSVGVQMSVVSTARATAAVSVAAITLVALAVGLIGAWLLSRRLRRTTSGLPLDTIVERLESRDALLLGLREGVLMVDTGGRLTLVNSAAERLLGLDGDAVGRPAITAIPPGRLQDLLLAGLNRTAADESTICVEGGRLLVVSRTTPVSRTRRIGNVLTLQDHTELARTVEQLNFQRSMTDALRAQAHEFRNRMQTVVGLIELGAYDKAIGYISRIHQKDADRTQRLLSGLGDSSVAALLIAKGAAATERGVALDVRVTGTAWLEATSDTSDEWGDEVVTAIANLLENAIEAAENSGKGEVSVHFYAREHQLVADVRDNGAGVPAQHAASIFRDGWSTKDSEVGKRGIGLALARQIARRHGGEISLVEVESGAMFRIELPMAVGATA